MSWKTVGTVVGFTVCTVGAAYAVNLASGETQILAIAAFLAIAVILTGIPAAFQVKATAQVEQAIVDNPISDRVRLRIVAPRRFLWSLIQAVVLTILLSLTVFYPDFASWASSKSTAWFEEDIFKSWIWTSVMPVYAMGAFLWGLGRFWKYSRSWLDMDEVGFERSRRILVQKIARYPWSSVDRIHQDPYGRLLIDLKADRLSEYGIKNADPGPYVLLNAAEYMDTRRFGETLYRFRRDSGYSFQYDWKRPEYPKGGQSSGQDDANVTINRVRQLRATRPSKG